MLHMILLILKIVGIALLGILGLLLLCILLVLFVPVRYKGQSEYIQEIFKGQGRITWLCHLVSAEVAYDMHKKKNPLSYSVKILGILILGTDKKKKSKKTETQKHVAKNKTHTELTQTEESTLFVEEHHDDKNTATSEDVCDANTSEGHVQSDVDQVQAHEKTENVYEDHQNVHTKKKKKFFKKIQEAFKTVKLKIESLINKISALCQKKEHLMDILFSEKNRSAFVFLKTSCLKLLSHILPRKLDGWLHFGMDDPEKTGRILGYIACFYPFYAQHIRVRPEFEQEVIEFKLSFAGRIRAFTIAFIGIKIVCNKALRRILSELKRL